MCRNLSCACGGGNLSSACGGGSLRSLRLATSHSNLVLCRFVPAGIDGWERHVACDDVTRGMSHVVTS